MKRTNKYSILLTTALALCLAPTAYSQDAPEEAEAAETAEAADTREFETVIVRGQFIPEPQRQTSQVATFLSSEDLARQGDANAALALTRLSGLSVVGEKFAYVRGLGDRYSAALLNGSPLPSPEPLRRTVPLDLFPSNALSGAAVQKTYSANYPAEFGGGLIDLKTLRQPDEPFLNLNVGVGYNTETTFKDGLFVRGSDTDWLGFDDGLRDLPGPISSIVSSGTRLQDLTDTERELAGESFVTGPLNVLQQGDIMADYNASIDGGTTLALGDFDLGLVGVAGYDRSWTTETSTRQFVESGIVGSEFEVTETTQDVTINALGSATLGWDEQEVAATLFYVHDTSKEAQSSTGIDFNVGDFVLDESSGWFERELAFFQLAGEHGFGDLEVNWRGAYAESSRDAPYELTLRRFYDTGGTEPTAADQPLYNVSGNYGLRFTELNDEVMSGGIDAAYTIPFGDTKEATISGGFDSSTTERTYDFLQFRFAGSPNDPDIEQARPDFLFSPDNIDPTRFRLQEIVTPNDSYAAELDVNAAFAQIDTDITNFIKATLGVRYEDAEQRVITFDRFGNLGGGDVELLNDYVLPAATLTWNFADDLQLRLGYSETIARPQFRELALSRYVDPQTDRAYRGNSELIDSELTNYDARLEYYMGRNQFITAAAFFKEIENPIEEYQFSTSTFVFETTFINSPKAELFGGELEYRTKFAMPFEGAFFDGRDWLFSANYTYTKSEIVADDDDLIFEPVTGTFVPAVDFAINGDQLQGTPENIANLQFGWESDVDQLTLLLGWVDERILQRGTQVLPDVIEDPGIQLDLVYRRDFNLSGREFTLGLTGRNLLNEDHEEFQLNEGDLGRTEFNTYERGTSLSASLTAKF
ncbi:MAG: TonB-dependent receptor [Henriciella sp.]